MPVPAATIAVTLKFSLNEGSTPVGVAEITNYMDYNHSDDNSDDVILAAFAAGAISAWEGSVHNTHYSTAVKLEEAIAVYLNPDGSTMAKQTNSTTTWVGAGGAPSLPWETSLVVSLYTYTPGTFVPDGRRRRGRNYLPPMSTAVLDGSNSGFVTTAVRDDALNDHHDYIRALALSAPGDTNGLAVVCSRAATHNYAITDLACDVRMDSQRRRERKQLPPKVSVEYVPI